jgi:hypothetical protein
MELTGDASIKYLTIPDGGTIKPTDGTTGMANQTITIAAGQTLVFRNGILTSYTPAP